MSISTRDKKRHTISFDNLTFDQFGDNPGAVVREKEQRPTLPEMFVGTDEPYSMKPGSRRSVHLGDLSGSKSVSVFNGGEFQKSTTSEDKSSKRKSYRSDDFKMADLQLQDQSPRTTGMSHSDSLPAMINNPRKLEELDTVLQKNLNGPPSLKKDASKKSKDKKDKEAKEKDKADKKKAKTLSEEMSKKLSKQAKTTALPSLLRTGSTPSVISSSGPGSVSSIAEEEEGPKTMPHFKTDDKKKDKLKRSGSSIKNPGVIYDLNDGKLVIVAGTEEKLIKTLVDANYTGIYLSCEIDGTAREMLSYYYKRFEYDLIHIYRAQLHEAFFHDAGLLHNTTSGSRQALGNTIPAGLDPLQVEQLEKFKDFTQAKVVDALLQWIDFFEHFLDDKTLLDKLVAFIKSLGPSEKNYTVRLAETLKNKLRPPTPTLPPAPESHIPEQLGTLRLAFMDFHPMEVARQLTLQDQTLLIKIKSSEFHKKRWAETDNAKSAPNLTAMIDRFNKVSYWVATEIVFQPELKKRIEVIKRWIVVAESFRSLGNFNGVMQICGGLHLTSIQRLKKTWKAMNKKFVQVFEALTDLMSNKGNYKAYREAVAAHPKDSPYIPYLGVILKDLTFMEDGNDDKDEDSSDMFNFDKLRMISEVLAEVNRIQRLKYNFNDVKPIQDYVDNAMTWALEDSQLSKYAEKLEGPEMHAKGQMTM